MTTWHAVAAVMMMATRTVDTTTTIYRSILAFLIVPGGHTTTLLLLVFELQFVILKVFIINIISIIVKTTGNIFAVKVPILYSMQHIYY